MVSASTAIAAALLATTTYVDAHGTLAKPALKFTGPNYAGDFYALVPMSALKPQPGDIFTNFPDWNKNAASFGRAFKASQYKSFKEFILKDQDLSKGRFSNPKTPECGFTDPNGPVVSLPDQLEWYGGQMNHPGPCEVWCDDELVVPFNTNCAQANPKGIIPYDKAKCVGKNLYTDCAHIGNGNGGGSSPSSAPSPSNQPSNRPSPTPSQKPAPGPPSSGGAAAVYQQCGGKNFNGPKQCQQGLTCKVYNEWYSQCIP
ncbi:hypothetical protein AC1031_005550 [Aphanomyces cochlioides]|nr:hypothetical protein AC1031_005550 [Aphanomyces cochlioides]